MKTIKDKELLVAADFAGFPLKEAVVAHLEAKGWGEAKIVMRFWVIAGVLALIGVFLATTGGLV